MAELSRLLKGYFLSSRSYSRSPSYSSKSGKRSPPSRSSRSRRSPSYSRYSPSRYGSHPYPLGPASQASASALICPCGPVPQTHLSGASLSPSPKPLMSSPAGVVGTG